MATQAGSRRDDDENDYGGAIRRRRRRQDRCGWRSEALGRLPKPLQTFVASYLDDDDRKKLSAEGVAFIIPELNRFRRLGADELTEFERIGHTFTVPKPERHRRDDNKNDLEL